MNERMESGALSPPHHVELACPGAEGTKREGGGVPARHARYDRTSGWRRTWRPGFGPTWTPVQGPIITTFRYPAGARFTFQQI